MARRPDSPPDPFSLLKGSGAFRGKKSEPPEAADEEDRFFVEEMARQGIGPGRDGASPEAPGDDAEGERELFLSALEEAVPGGEPESTGPESRHARARRERRLARGEIVPGDRLDLHGLHRAEALARLRIFLERAGACGEEAVLVITGRGRGSERGPVLGQAVRESLDRDQRDLVLEWCRAPRRMGGDGALVVFLRQR